MPRTDHVHALAGRLGPKQFQISELSDGWPSLCRIRIDASWRRVALHVGLIATSHRGRDDVERRFQNPGKGKPIQAPSEYYPLLIGLQYGEKNAIRALVGMDARIRVGRGTRFSLFVPVATLDEAVSTGWAEHTSGSEEIIHAFLPELLPVFASLNNVATTTLPEIPSIVDGSGLLDKPGDEEAAERARRAATRVVRKHDFGKKVVKAYQGLCAMCGLGSGLVEGAHIYPVQAPSSPDKIWNGLALCPIHHRVFDRHLCYVDPSSGKIKFSPVLLRAAASSPALKAFIDTTRAVLEVPVGAAHKPQPEMFRRRYAFFEEAYGWIS